MNSTLFSYGFLYLAVALLWVPSSRNIPYWVIALLGSIIFGLVSHQLEFVALIPVISLAVMLYIWRTNSGSILVRCALGLFIVVLSIGLSAHQLPGFNNLNVIDHVYLSKNAVPFSMYLNFDKAIMGVLMMGLFCRPISNRSEWGLLFKQVLVRAPLVILVVIILALVLGVVRFDPKIAGGIFIWIVTNLLFVCVAEEALFRGFIQQDISFVMNKIKCGNYFALIIAAVLFGLAHYAGGARYVVLASVAGMGYGWIYLATKRIEGGILTHFGLNLTHFLFFTYPALARGV